MNNPQRLARYGRACVPYFVRKFPATVAEKKRIQRAYKFWRPRGKQLAPGAPGRVNWGRSPYIKQLNSIGQAINEKGGGSRCVPPRPALAPARPYRRRVAPRPAPPPPPSPPSFGDSPSPPPMPPARPAARPARRRKHPCVKFDRKLRRGRVKVIGRKKAARKARAAGVTNLKRDLRYKAFCYDRDISWGDRYIVVRKKGRRAGTVVGYL